MTSNIGSELILSAQQIDQKLKDHIDALLHKQFKPEFLNRIDELVFFNKLTQPDVAKIALLQINTIIKRLEKQSIKLNVDDEVIILLASEGYDADFGARPLKRVINQQLIAPLSTFILKNPTQKNIHIMIKQATITIA